MNFGIISIALLASLAFLLTRSRKSRQNGKKSGMRDPAMKIFQAARDLGFSNLMSRILVAQAIHETGNFTSQTLMSLNNMFGMKMPRIRPTRAIETDKKIEGDPAAKFASIKDSVEDLALWLDYNRLPKDYSSPEDYVSAIRRKGYFTDSYINYLTAVKNWLKTT